MLKYFIIGFMINTTRQVMVPVQKAIRKTRRILLEKWIKLSKPKTVIIDIRIKKRKIVIPSKSLMHFQNNLNLFILDSSSIKLVAV